MIGRRALLLAALLGGTGMGQWGQPNRVSARQVIISGTGNGVGLFEYNGAAAAGNPPVAYAVPPGVTKDPYGNTLPAGGGGFVSASALAFSQLKGGNILIGVNGAAGIPSSLFSNSTLSNGTLAIDSGLDAAGHHSATIELHSNASASGVGVVIAPDNGGALTTSMLEVQGQIATTGFAIISAGGDLQSVFGNVHVAAAGSGLRVAEGSNAKQGRATLVAGTKLVANTSITALSGITLTAQDNNSTGALRVSARTAGTSFTITSSNAMDSGVVFYEIFEPG